MNVPHQAPPPMQQLTPGPVPGPAPAPSPFAAQSGPMNMVASPIAPSIPPSAIPIPTIMAGYGLVPPAAAFWVALLNAQKEAKELEKLHDGPPNKKLPKTYERVDKTTGEIVMDHPPMWKFVSAEDFIREARRVLHKHGLFCAMIKVLGEPEGQLGRRSRYACAFVVVHAETGQGGVFPSEVSIAGEDNVEAADTRAISYFLRGFLMIARNDPREELAYEESLVPQDQQFAQQAVTQAFAPQQQAPAQGYQQQGQFSQQQPQGGFQGQQQNQAPAHGYQQQGQPRQQGYPQQNGQANGQFHGQQQAQGAPQGYPQQGQHQHQQPHQGFNMQQQAPPQLPPVGLHPTVQAAAQILEVEQGFGGQHQPESSGPGAAIPGAQPGEPQTMDDWVDLLYDRGWNEQVAINLATFAQTGQAVPSEVRALVLTEARKFYGPNNVQGMREAWKGTGFEPAPNLPEGQRPVPTGLQLLRYCAKMNFPNPGQNAPAQAGA